MTNYNELVQRLRKPEVRNYQVSGTGEDYRTAICERPPLPILIEAADAIVQLQARVAELEEIVGAPDNYITISTSVNKARLDEIVRLSDDLAAAMEEFHYQACLTKELMPYQERAIKAEADLVAARAELQNIANARPQEWEPDVRDQFQQWAQSRARLALAGKDAT